MFQILKTSNFDFMAWRKPLLLVTLVIVAFSVVLIVKPGPKMGIEFTGGSELQVKFSAEPNIADIRKVIHVW